MKHKIIISLMLLSFIGQLGFAQQVSQTEAINAAINIMRYETRDKVYIDSINGVYNKIIDSDTILYEVSFNDGSAVLLSGNKSCIPFLGMITPDEDFAFSSVLENVDNPEVVNCFIDTYCEQIKYCFDSRASSLLEQNEWDKLLQYDTSYYNNLERSKVGPLITTKWGQSRSNGIIYDEHAYNYYVNDNSSYCDGYCFAGCIAVSMAQILRYWNRPSENPSKCYQYDWNNMPNKLKRINTNYKTQRNAVAKLIYDCAESVGMEYCYIQCFSFADSEIIPDAFMKFGYNNAKYEKRCFYTNEEWHSMLRNSLDNHRPIIYGGYNNVGGGHAFICDGYKKRIFGDDYLYHFNWGENGKSNGWFFIDMITTKINTYIGYIYNQDAIFDIYPSKCWENIIIECNKTINNNTNKNYCINNNFENNYNNYVIKSGGSVSLHASNEIILSDGFYATEGANFMAEVIAHDLSGNATVTSRSNQDMNDQHEDDDVIYKDEVELLPSNANPSHISIYPNPANDNITIELAADCHTIEIYDSFGRMMMSHQVAKTLSQQVVDVDISKYPSGLYLVVVKDDNNRYYKRIVKN